MQQIDRVRIVDIIAFLFADAILDAWNSTLSNHVVGSSTICVATIDTTLNQLSYSNLGDGGLMVVRHTGSGTAGFVKDMSNDDSDRTSKFSLAYLSQQQLRSFNLPYQLGYSGSVEYGGSFENPIDADTGIQKNHHLTILLWTNYNVN